MTSIDRVNPFARPRVGLSIALDAAWRHAVRPLFVEGLVEALEWDVDYMWGFGDQYRAPPPWTEGLLDTFAADGALYGHGVYQSPFSARWQPRQAAWLDHFAIEVARRPYRHITEHTCFFTGGSFVLGPMLPPPPVDAASALGRERLARMAALASCPVGLENLAGVLGAREAWTQGDLLDAVLAPGDGVLLLDVHNVYVMARNLDLDPIAVLDTFPLHRVRELHVAGGQTTTTSSGRPLLLDGHDGPVRDGVFPLLGAMLARCPGVEVVFLERRNGTLETPEEVEALRADYRRLHELVTAAPRSPAGASAPVAAARPAITTGVSRDELADYQAAVLGGLAGAASAEAAIAAITAAAPPGALRDHAMDFDSSSVELAIALTRRWGLRDAARSGHQA